MIFGCDLHIGRKETTAADADLYVEGSCHIDKQGAKMNFHANHGKNLLRNVGSRTKKLAERLIVQVRKRDQT
jgi:hypothetical protein